MFKRDDIQALIEALYAWEVKKSSDGMSNPEPSRVRFKIKNDGTAYFACTNTENILYAASKLTHECNLDDCYPPGDDLCSFKEMVDAEVSIRRYEGEYWVYNGPGVRADTIFADWNAARRRASELTRQRKGE